MLMIDPIQVWIIFVIHRFILKPGCQCQSALRSAALKTALTTEIRSQRQELKQQRTKLQDILDNDKVRNYHAQHDQHDALTNQHFLHTVYSRFNKLSRSSYLVMQQYRYILVIKKVVQ